MNPYSSPDEIVQAELVPKKGPGIGELIWRVFIVILVIVVVELSLEVLSRALGS